MVETYCKEPWLLGWEIGNENDCYIKGIGGLQGLAREPINMSEKDYYAFMDELASVVKNTEQLSNVTHPVVLGHSGPGQFRQETLRLIGEMRNFDAIGLNVFRDVEGFNDLFKDFKNRKPIIISEFGATAYVDPELKSEISQEDAESSQARYNVKIWQTIKNNMAGGTGSGNALAAFCFIFTNQMFQVNSGQARNAYFGVKGKLAQDMFKNMHFEKIVVDENESTERIRFKAWDALRSQELDTAIKAAEIILSRHEAKAKIEQAEKAKKVASGEDFKYVYGNNASNAMEQKIKYFESLNLAGELLYIMGRAYVKKRDCENARTCFEKTIREYSLAQAWDSRGWFWKPALEAQNDLDKIIPLLSITIPLTIEGPESGDGIDFSKKRSKSQGKGNKLLGSPASPAWVELLRRSIEGEDTQDVSQLIAAIEYIAQQIYINAQRNCQDFLLHLDEDGCLQIKGTQDNVLMFSLDSDLIETFVTVQDSAGGMTYWDKLQTRLKGRKDTLIEIIPKGLSLNQIRSLLIQILLRRELISKDRALSEGNLQKMGIIAASLEQRKKISISSKHFIDNVIKVGENKFEYNQNSSGIKYLLHKIEMGFDVEIINESKVMDSELQNLLTVIFDIRQDKIKIISQDYAKTADYKEAVVLLHEDSNSDLLALKNNGIKVIIGQKGVSVNVLISVGIYKLLDKSESEMKELFLSLGYTENQIAHMNLLFLQEPSLLHHPFRQLLSY